MVPRPQLHRSKRTILAAGARTNCNYLSLHRLFFCCFGDDDAARSLLFTLDSTDKHPVAQRPKGHEPLRGLQFNVIDGYPSLRRHVSCSSNDFRRGGVTLGDAHYARREGSRLIWRTGRISARDLRRRAANWFNASTPTEKPIAA